MTPTSLSLAFSPLTLPNGQVLKNRIAKAATEENLGSAGLFLAPSQQLIQLYKTWAEGGSGLIISGNVMVDYLAVGGVAPVCTSRELVSKIKENKLALQAFHDWSSAARANGAQFWLQLNHPGRQAFAPAASKIIAPSATAAVDVGRVSKAFFSMPREMSDDEIVDAIARFAEGARFAETIGATGVQIHGAHGYLVNQFLSPLNNTRTDRWGGTLEKRATFLIEVVKAIRSAVSPSFAVGLKLSSSDFQRGGLSQEDAQWIIEKLNSIVVPGRGGLDLIEVSGGNYESPAMSGSARPGSGYKLEKEAYFLEFAHRVTSVNKMPIMVTGGIRRAEVIAKVVAPAPGQTEASVKTIAGMGTALALLPDLPHRLEAGEDPCPALTSGPSLFIPSLLLVAAVGRQVQFSMRAIANGKEASPAVSQVRAMISDQFDSVGKLREYKKLVRRLQG